MSQITFKFAPEKARAAIHWMVSEKQTVDLHTMLKACYFADREHLNKYGRPIFGARYRAMKFGPVPLEIYEMAKGESLWKAELGADSFPWQLEGYTLRVIGNEAPDMGVFSESDREELQAGFEKSCSMTFGARTAATHGPDWQAAKLGMMSYEDMLEESDEKAQRVEILRETAPFVRL